MDTSTQPQVEPERLPDYEEDVLPSYVPSPSIVQSSCLKLKQWDRTTQKFVPLSSSSASGSIPSSLAITTRTKFHLFSNPPDIRLVLEKQDGAPVPTEPTTVTIRFDAGGRTLPWHPRATMKVMGGNGILVHKQEMASHDFIDWKVVVDGAEMHWCLKNKPAALVLRKKGVGRGRGREIARWTYSEFGIEADHGAYMGELMIHEREGEGEANTGDQAGLRTLVIAASCYSTIIYWRKLGRHYRNKAMCEQDDEQDDT